MQTFKRNQKGQSAVEFFVVTGALVAALLMPIPENELGGFLEEHQGHNALEILTQKIKDSYHAYSYAKSITPLPSKIINK
ncbi:hypothetical protein [Pseudoalteromonas sp. T1lg24]|uniref:hypothetical protein n=1 Tax=Pseudoalteromonas sp. T1lg24 TaxID=2077099 RepID=UPI000CF6F79A|nr:hypothetical protein [Pseudoalteromonas sp. T1lg24]